MKKKISKKTSSEKENHKQSERVEELVFNPFTKENPICKIIEVEHKGESAVAKAWFPIDSNFTVLMVITRDKPDERWKVIGFPTKQ